MIRWCGEEEEKKLLGRHGELTKCLGVEQSYSDLFRGTAPEDLESLLNFPRELIRLVAGYPDSVATARKIEKKFIHEFF